MRKDRILKLLGPPDEKPDAAKRGVVTQAGRKRIRAKTGGTCHVCGGRAGKRWHADHVKPRRLGGKSEESNYLPTCHPRRLDGLDLANSRRFLPHFVVSSPHMR